jgi:hypothetical protein
LRSAPVAKIVIATKSCRVIVEPPEKRAALLQIRPTVAQIKLKKTERALVPY